MGEVREEGSYGIVFFSILKFFWQIEYAELENGAISSSIFDVNLYEELTLYCTLVYENEVFVKFAFHRKYLSFYAAFTIGLFQHSVLVSSLAICQPDI